MELPELHKYAVDAGIEMSELLSGTDINAASREELSAALNNDQQLADAIYDHAQYTEIESQRDAQLHVRGFKQNHALALTKAGIRYPAVGIDDGTMSFHPALQQARTKDRVKDLGELTVEKRM